MTMPLIISYNTPDPIYQAAADRLKRSLGKFKLSCEIICCTPRGAWIDNCAYIYDDGEVPIILQHQVSRNGRNLYP